MIEVLEEISINAPGGQGEMGRIEAQVITGDDPKDAPVTVSSSPSRTPFQQGRDVECAMASSPLPV